MAVNNVPAGGGQGDGAGDEVEIYPRVNTNVLRVCRLDDGGERIERSRLSQKFRSNKFLPRLLCPNSCRSYRLLRTGFRFR